MMIPGDDVPLVLLLLLLGRCEKKKASVSFDLKKSAVGLFFDFLSRPHDTTPGKDTDQFINPFTSQSVPD